MSSARLNEILTELGISRRDMARRVPWLGHDGKEVSRWRTGASPIPDSIGQWLEELWDVREDDEATEKVWSKPPPPPNAGYFTVEADDLPMAPREFVEVMQSLDLTYPDLERFVSWLERGEAEAWASGEEPIEPSVARWLRALLEAQGDSVAERRLRRRPPPQPLPGTVRYQRMRPEDLAEHIARKEAEQRERNIALASDSPEEWGAENPDPNHSPGLDEIL